MPPQNPGDYPPTMGTSQDQALGNENFRQKKSLFRRYIAVDEAFKNQIVTAVQPVFLHPLVDQLKGFIHVSVLDTGKFPSLVGNRLGFAVAKILSQSVLCIYLL